MSPEQVTETREALREERIAEGGKYIGLRSTMLLLKACFRGDVGFALESVAGEGTLVEVDFPLQNACKREKFGKSCAEGNI